MGAWQKLRVLATVGVSSPAVAAPVGIWPDPTLATLVALLAALWFGAAVWALVRSARLGAEVADQRELAYRYSALVSTSPSAWMLASENGEIATSDQLPIWLGLDKPPTQLDELESRRFDGVDGGIDGECHRRLKQDIKALALSGNGFSALIPIAATGRVLRAEGRLADSVLIGERGVVIWFSDETDEQAGITRMGENTARLNAALGAMATLIEAAPFPMWHRDPAMALTLVNSAYVRAVEAPDAAHVVARGLELVDSPAGPAPADAARAANEQQRPLSRNAPAIVAGERRMLRIVEVPLGDAGVAGFAFDIEDLEQARAEMKRFGQAQRDMLDRLSASVAQFGQDHSLVFFNRPFARAFGLDPDWLAEHPEFDRVLERMRENQRLPESRDFPNWKAERRAWFTANSDAVEETWALADGMHLRVLAQPLPNGGLLLVFEDRTEQFRLASSRDTLLRVQAATLDNLFEAVGVFAGDGRLQLLNQRFANIWGLDQEELRSFPHVDALVRVAAEKLHQPSQAESLREIVRSATVDRQPRSGRFALADGRHQEFAAVPLPDGNALFTLLDVTDSRRIEAALRERNEALEAADRVKSQFVAHMSYKLRTPLTSIRGFAEMLIGGYAGTLDARAGDYITSILGASERLELLIDDILDLSITETGELELAFEPVDIAALARDAVAGAEEAATARGLTLVAEVDDNAGTVYGDSRRLWQSLGNLLSNALAFTPDGGRIVVHASGDHQQAVLAVSDSGIGIAPEKKDKLMNRLYRRDEADNESMGLGLPLVRQLVGLHGGSVGLRSQEGEGTTVTISLPREG